MNSIVLTLSDSSTRWLLFNEMHHLYMVHIMILLEKLWWKKNGQYQLHFKWLSLIVAGDSCIIRQSTETTASSRHSSSAMKDSDQCLDDGGLARGSFLKKLANTIFRRLDRVFFNDAWLSHFSSSTVEFLSPGVSDSSSEKKVSLIKKEKKRSSFLLFPPFLTL